jgi:hypothetical protein
MNDYMTFESEAEACAYLMMLRGWPGKIANQVYLPDMPDNPKAGEEGNVWVITLGDGKYLRRDGFFR